MPLPLGTTLQIRCVSCVKSCVKLCTIIMNHTTQLCGSYSTQLYTTLHNGFAVHGGHKYNLKTYNPLPYKDEFCQISLKSKRVFWRSRWNSLLFKLSPLPNLLPPSGAQPPRELSWITLNSSPKKVSTHSRTWLFYCSIWIWRTRCLKFREFWLLGPSPGPHGGHVYNSNNFECPSA